MRGRVFKRYKNSWAIVLDLGYRIDPKDGKKKRKQKWVAFKGTKKQADAKCAELSGQVYRKEFVEPLKITVGEWMTEWLETTVKPSSRPHTYKSYETTIRKHLKPALGDIPLQQLTATDIERYHAERPQLSAGTRQTHHAILSTALNEAVAKYLVFRNVAKIVKGKPHPDRTTDDLIANCWSVQEARAFLAATKSESAQVQAFYSLALDTGARKAELHGLKWEDVNLDTGSLRIVRQLDRRSKRDVGEDGEVRIVPDTGPTKTKRARTIDLGPETMRLLREHRRTQAELKMKNRDHYRDHGFVFACELRDPRDPQGELGMPLSFSTLGSTVFKRLIKAAGVRRIRFHGLRHTSATLLLGAGEPAITVANRLGHTDVTITLNTYGHVMPSMQQQAAARLGALLHG